MGAENLQSKESVEMWKSCSTVSRNTILAFKWKLGRRIYPVTSILSLFVTQTNAVF